jgi:hypothetical protein
MKCRWCNLDGVMKQGSGHYCLKHGRFLQMRINAKFKGKTVPSYEELEECLNLLIDFLCPHCHRRMCWRRRDGQSTVLTLQHDRSGKFKFLCFGCNTAHQFDQGDEFYNRTPGRKTCRDCGLELPLDAFWKDRRVKTGVKSYCKRCANIRIYAWRRTVAYHGKSDWVAN